MAQQTELCRFYAMEIMRLYEEKTEEIILRRLEELAGKMADILGRKPKK